MSASKDGRGTDAEHDMLAERERQSMHYDIGFQLVYSLWATTLSLLMHAREDDSIVHCPQIFKQAFKIIQR